MTDAADRLADAADELSYWWPYDRGTPHSMALEKLEAALCAYREARRGAHAAQQQSEGSLLDEADLALDEAMSDFEDDDHWQDWKQRVRVLLKRIRGREAAQREPCPAKDQRNAKETQ